MEAILFTLGNCIYRSGPGQSGTVTEALNCGQGRVGRAKGGLCFPVEESKRRGRGDVGGFRLGRAIKSFGGTYIRKKRVGRETNFISGHGFFLANNKGQNT